MHELHCSKINKKQIESVSSSASASSMASSNLNATASKTKNDKIKKKFLIKNVRNFFSFLAVKFFNFFPHLRNHHFLVLKKLDQKSKILKNLKTTDLNSWVKFRENINFK
jgi:hypothetical protein